MRGSLQPVQPHEQPVSRSSRWVKIIVTQDRATFFFGVMTPTRCKCNTAHSYTHKQHSTYLHPRTTDHIHTSTNNTAHTYTHKQHSTHVLPRTTQHTPTSKNKRAHTYIQEQHSTYLHPRTTQHIPTSTNNTAHTYVHEQHSTYLQPRTTHNFREFRSGRVRRELIWMESWQLLSQELEFLQRTQKASINFILYCTPQVYKVLSCLAVFLKKFGYVSCELWFYVSCL